MTDTICIPRETIKYMGKEDTDIKHHLDMVTAKMIKDIKRYIMKHKLALPKTGDELIKVLNNYIKAFWRRLWHFSAYT